MRVALVLERPGWSPESAASAVRLSRQLGAEVLVDCVVEQDARWSGRDDGLISAAHRDVQALVDRLQAEGVSAAGEVTITLAGQSAPAVLKAADDFDAELMLVIARQAPRLTDLLRRSLPDRLLRSRRRPLLLIPDGRSWQPKSPSPERA